MYEIKSYIILVEFSLFRVDEFVKFEESSEKLPVHTKGLDIITTGKIYYFITSILQLLASHLIPHIC